MTRVLVAYDGSPPARTAIERAAALLRPADPDAGPAEAVVVAVAENLDELADAAASGRMALPDEVLRTATERLRESAVAEAEAHAEEGARLATESGFASVRREVRSTTGPVWSAVADAAREAEADAIACGTHGHGAATRAILGSVASGVMQHAELPVLLVRERAVAGSGPIVVGWDGSEHAAGAVAACGRLMPGREALATYVWRSRFRHTLTGSALRQGPLEEVRDAVAELDAMVEQWAREEAEKGAERGREAGLAATALPFESDDSPSAALLDAAAEADACVIAVGRRGRGAVASVLLGSVSRSLLHGSDRPLLVT